MRFHLADAQDLSHGLLEPQNEQRFLKILR